MATKFKGYLLKFGDQVFPNQYLSFDNNTSTPNQRTEIDAYRDGNNLLHRQTSPNYKTKLEYTIKEGLTLEQKIEWQNIVKSGLVNAQQRKYQVTYWNDEINDYKTMTAYIPDTEYPIQRIDQKSGTIYYQSVRLALIEY